MDDYWEMTIRKKCACGDGYVTRHASDAALDEPCTDCNGTGVITRDICLWELPETIRLEEIKADPQF